MKKDVFTFLVGGKAGEGVKKAGLSAAHLFAKMGRHVFEMDDYQSLIKGGHNFSVISTSVDEIFSHYMNADLVVALDARSYELHNTHLSSDGVLVYNSDAVHAASGLGIPMTTEAKKYPEPELRIGLAAIAALANAIGLTRAEFSELIKAEYSRDLENNLAYAERMFELMRPDLGNKFELERTIAHYPMLTGNEAIALGAAAAGLDIYFAYPMTPTSSILHYLAANERSLKLVTVHPENELAVMNMAIGAAAAGAHAMVASSGGGFALMQEAISLAGMTETPVLCVLGSRPGPSTGVPTYTSQCDLRFALNQGHGEFPRFVASPGTTAEAFYLSAELMDLAWHFQTPAILLTEKHMGECLKTIEIDVSKARQIEPVVHHGGAYKRYSDTPDGLSPLLFPPSRELIKWNSYEHDESGITTEDPVSITRMRNKLNRKQKTIIRHMTQMRTLNTFGSGNNRIFTYGSTTMSVLESVRAANIDCTVIQIVYLEPLPVWALEQYRTDNGGRNIAVELSANGFFGSLLNEKADITIHDTILKYDGRPFDPTELAVQIRRLM